MSAPTWFSVPAITEKDRYMALRWAYALESSKDPHYSAELLAGFKERGALIRRIVGASPDEDLSRYQMPHPDEIAAARAEAGDE